MRILFRIERRKGGEVTAILPDVEANPGHWTCYAHWGQHGECTRAWHQTTRRATPSEYHSLLQELRHVYAPEPLRVMQRLTS